MSLMAEPGPYFARAGPKKTRITDMNNQISAFEYISILVSIILGLGITQILSSLADVLYGRKKEHAYWPHLVWVAFILFLHLQDWFIIYELKDRPSWSFPVLLFILAYPVALFITAKMLFPREQVDASVVMKDYFFSQYPLIFLMVSLCIVLSISFNVTLLGMSWKEQVPLFLFLFSLLAMVLVRPKGETIQKIIASVLLLATIVAILLEKNTWVVA
jgi:hypothetical protein